jgi:hypothetical protein
MGATLRPRRWCFVAEAQENVDGLRDGVSHFPFWRGGVRTRRCCNGSCRQHRLSRPAAVAVIDSSGGAGVSRMECTAASPASSTTSPSSSSAAAPPAAAATATFTPRVVRLQQLVGRRVVVVKGRVSGKELPAVLLLAVVLVSIRVYLAAMMVLVLVWVHLLMLALLMLALLIMMPALLLMPA